MSRSSNADMQLFVDRLLNRSVLSDEEQQAILDLPATPTEVRRKHDFVGMDEEVSQSCLVVSGMVGRFGQTSDGARQITAFHVPGDMADLHSAIRPIGVGGLNALCETTILRIPHLAIRELAACYPAIAEAFWRDCLLDAAVLMQWVVNVGRRDAPTRLAHILCEMAIRCGGDLEVSTDYTFPITQEQLAEAAALTSVHVNRSLKVLSNLATIKAGHVTIHDWKGLARSGDFDAQYLVADTGPDRQKRLLSTN